MNQSVTVHHLAPIISFHHKLVSSRYQRETICVVELSSYILSKCISSTTWRYSPTTTIVWIRPQEITHWSFMRNLCIEKHNCHLPGNISGQPLQHGFRQYRNEILIEGKMRDPKSIEQLVRLKQIINSWFNQKEKCRQLSKLMTKWNILKAITNYNEELQVEISNKVYYFAYHTLGGNWSLTRTWFP